MQGCLNIDAKVDPFILKQDCYEKYRRELDTWKDAPTKRPLKAVSKILEVVTRSHLMRL